jgi:hypothetical protein
MSAKGLLECLLLRCPGTKAIAQMAVAKVNCIQIVSNSFKCANHNDLFSIAEEKYRQTLQEFTNLVKANQQLSRPSNS